MSDSTRRTRWLVLLVLLAGCGTAGSPVFPTTSTPTVEPARASRWQPSTPLPQVMMSDEEKQRVRLEQLADQAKAAGLENPVMPDLVRWIYPEEIGSTIVPCLNDKGFLVTANASGTGYSGDISGGQDKAAALAQWQCAAMYSLDPRVTIPATSAQMGIAYDYVVQFLVPCLAKQGYTNLEVPSREVFLANDGYLEDFPKGDETLCPFNPPTNAVLGEVLP